MPRKTNLNELKVNRVIVKNAVIYTVPNGEKWLIRRVIPSTTGVLVMKDTGGTNWYLALAKFLADDSMSGCFGDINYVELMSGEQLSSLGCDWWVYYDKVI